MDLESMLRDCMKCGDETENRGHVTPEDLKGLLKTFNEKHEFKPGMLIKWKKGMKIQKFPEEGEPVIVVKVLDEPVFGTTDESGSPYFRIPLDIICGIVMDEIFELFHYDSRRFEPYL